MPGWPGSGSGTSTPFSRMHCANFSPASCIRSRWSASLPLAPASSPPPQAAKAMLVEQTAANTAA
jgi:hypothetical protein